MQCTPHVFVDSIVENSSTPVASKTRSYRSQDIADSVITRYNAYRFLPVLVEIPQDNAVINHLSSLDITAISGVLMGASISDDELYRGSRQMVIICVHCILESDAKCKSL